MSDGERDKRFILTLDFRDVLAAAGALAIVGGAVAISWGLAFMLAGLAACGAAYWLSR